MAKCTRCGKRLLSSSSEVSICSHCGHAEGAGVLLLGEQDALPEEDQFSEHSLIRTMGKLALLLLLLLLGAALVYGQLAMQEQAQKDDFPSQVQ